MRVQWIEATISRWPLEPIWLRKYIYQQTLGSDPQWGSGQYLLTGRPIEGARRSSLKLRIVDCTEVGNALGEKPLLWKIALCSVVLIAKGAMLLRSASLLAIVNWKPIIM